MTHVTCRLTAKNRDQLRNPTLGNRVWATFTFLVWVRLSSGLDVGLEALQDHLWAVVVLVLKNGLSYITGLSP